MRPALAPALRLPQVERTFRRPVLVSAGVHVLLVLLLLWQADRQESLHQRIPGALGPVGGGGERVAYLELPALRTASAAEPVPQLVQPKTLPVPQVQVEDISKKPVMPDLLRLTVALGPLPSLAGPGSGTRGRIGNGSGNGVGNAAGPGTGGAGGDVFPPQARFSILPPLPRPAAVRGRAFRVHFWVDATGRVTKVEVAPTIPDADYRKKFVELMYQYTFSPAMQPDGTPVNGETVLTITL
jgi:hypothetical protein